MVDLYGQVESITVTSSAVNLPEEPLRAPSISSTSSEEADKEVLLVAMTTFFLAGLEPIKGYKMIFCFLLDGMFLSRIGNCQSLFKDCSW